MGQHSVGYNLCPAYYFAAVLISWGSGWDRCLRSITTRVYLNLRLGLAVRVRTWSIFVFIDVHEEKWIPHTGLNGVGLPPEGYGEGDGGGVRSVVGRGWEGY